MCIRDSLYNVMYAQFAQAGVFPPVEFNNTDYFDGSTIWDLDIFSVVNQCQAQGFADSDIVVDVLLTSEKTLKKVDASDYKSIQMLWRYLEVSRYYSNMDGLLRAQFAYPNVTFRNVVAPSAEMPSSFYPLVSALLLRTAKFLTPVLLLFSSEPGPVAGRPDLGSRCVGRYRCRR